MYTRRYSRTVTAVFAVLLAFAAGCNGGSPSESSRGGGAGTVGQSFDVTVFRPTAGTVTSTDGRINCGTAPGATTCGPVSFAWTTTVTLTATPDAGVMFAGWAGDCTGMTCALDTAQSGADKYVVAVFGENGLTQHPNWSNVTPRADGTTIHGQQFLAFIDTLDIQPESARPAHFNCTASACHGASYNGAGIAPSCTACHTRNGHPSWRTECNFCHGAPPADPHPPSLAAPALPGCNACHPDTYAVDAASNVSMGPTHMNGKIDGGGHEDGYAAPSWHGRDFFVAVASVTAEKPKPSCTKCHADDYGNTIAFPEVAGGPMRSCNSCHLAAGWQGGAVAGAGWQTNCSFCHGVRDATTQAAPYDVNAFPVQSAPPQAIAERVGDAATVDPANPIDVAARNGAHTKHLTSTTYTVVACADCHPVPASLAHIGGRNVRAAMVAGLNYDTTALTCAGSCHVSKPSPAWNAPGPLACDGCHDVPPSTTAHTGLTGTDLGGECSGCHDETITATGQFAAGHMNGTPDVPAGHASATFYDPRVHGPIALDSFAGVNASSPENKSCNQCHVEYRNCDACHANPPAANPALAAYPTQWVSWDANCTFCHGTRIASYSAANPAHLEESSPGDSIAMRLGNYATPTTADNFRIGKHRSHVQRGTGVGDAEYPAIRCTACHVVPTTLNHVTAGTDRRAAVVFDTREAIPGLTDAQYAALPDPIATYRLVPATNPPQYECYTYCHGSNPQTGAALWGGSAPGTRPRWGRLFTNVSCTSCHGFPPPTGKVGPTSGMTMHELHDPIMNGDSCGGCHTTPAEPVHVNGLPNVMPTLKNGATYDATTKSCSAPAALCHAGDATSRSWY